MAPAMACSRSACLALTTLLFAASPHLRLAAGEDEEPVAFSLIAAGVRCSNSVKDLSFSVGSAEQCAELVCEDPQCGPLFDHGAASRRCSCLEEGQACQESKDPSTSRYRLTDEERCKAVLGADCFATLHENGDFSGWSASFSQGAYGGADFEATGAVLRATSALFVSPGCIATLYQNPDFSGWAVTFSEGSYTADEFVAKGAKDEEASAVVVRHPRAPDPLQPQAADAPAKPAAAAASAQGSPKKPGSPAPPPRPPVPPKVGAAKPAAPRATPQDPSLVPNSISSPPKRCSVSVAKDKDLEGWKCDLAAKKGCSKEELEFLAEAEKEYELPRKPGEPKPTSWRGDLERVESEALMLYFTRNDVRKAHRVWQIKKIAILLHLCHRGEGQAWGLNAPKQRQEL